jgi:basic membrane protein A and related proteins
MKSIKTLIVAITAIAVLLAGCAPAKKEEAKKEAAKGPKYKVGLVFDVGGRGDKSFNDSAYQGLVKAATAFKGVIKDDPSNVNFGGDIELKYLEPKQGGQDREQLMRALAQEGYNLIYGIGFMFTDPLVLVAKDFPKVHFALIDGYIPDLKDSSNVTCLSFAEQEGSFLVGAIAGLSAGNNKVGFIGGMDMPLIHKFHAGFFAGAIYVNKNLRAPKALMAQYIGKDPSAFNDPKTAESIAVNFYKQGASIVYHAAGGSGNGLFKAAKDQKKLAIGVDSDQGLIYSTAKTPEEQATGKVILTSMLKRVDNSVFLTVKDLVEKGAVAGGYRTFSLADDGVGYADNEYNKALLAPYKAQLDDLKAKIIKGDIKVPDDDAKLGDWVKTALI